MEYNSQRSEFKFTEYGRHVQMLIDYAVALPDREQRNLWDHLFIMSEFKMDCDSPYPKPSPELIKYKPEKINYPSYKVPYRHYGNNLLKMIKETKKMENGDAKDAVTTLIATYMKQSYVNWNRDNVEDEIIFEQLKKLSDGELQVKENTRLAHVRETNNNIRHADDRKKRKVRKGGYRRK
jgi:hypothetical protein